MLKGTFPVEKFKQLSTPFYYYDVKLLQDTLDVVKPNPENMVTTCIMP